MKLANVKNQEYTKEMFKDIAFFTLAEPGAMGVGNLMEFITAEGEEFSLFFSEEMPYSKVKEYFPALDDCYWNGPESDESCRTEFVFYLSKDERNFKHTKPPKNYTHLYEGFGNHICIRKDYYPVVEPIIRDLIEKNELVNWYTRTGEIIDAIKTLTAEKKEGKNGADNKISVLCPGRAGNDERGNCVKYDRSRSWRSSDPGTEGDGEDYRCPRNPGPDAGHESGRDTGKCNRGPCGGKY